MGSPTLEKIRSEALSLPEAERAELAHKLVASLDGRPDFDVERRLAEIDSGTANAIGREIVDDLEAALEQCRLIAGDQGADGTTDNR